MKCATLRRVLICILGLGMIAAFTACTSKTPESKPLPDLTFEHVQPLAVNVAVVEIENNFDPLADVRDVSSSFPSAPDVAVRRLAENRIKAAGTQGTLKFIIEDAHIHRSLVQPAGKFTGWLGINRKDFYEVTLRVRLYVNRKDGTQTEHSILNLQRSIAIPQRYSVADKELEKFKFLEMLMDDVDRAVTEALRDRMNLVVI